MEIVTRVDDYFLRAKTTIPYPSIVIDSKNIEALPVLLECVEEGNVSVIFEYGGKFNVAKKKISNSALTLAKILEVYKFTILDPDVKYPVTNVRDILEFGEWTY